MTLGVQGRGRGDPTYRLGDGGAIWRTSLTPDGPGTIRVLPPAGWVVSPDDGSASTRVRAQAWGPGAGWLLDALPAALGRDDDSSGFDASCHPLIWDSARRHPGLRLGAVRPADGGAGARPILEQKVVDPGGTPGVADPAGQVRDRAARARAAGHAGLPAAGGVAAHPVLGVAPGRGGGGPGGDDHQGRDASPASLERLLEVGHEEADRKLRTIPGIGDMDLGRGQAAGGGRPGRGLGRRLPPARTSSAGPSRAGTGQRDEEMLALLEPFKGHRHRATRLIGLSGGARPARPPQASGVGTGTVRYGAGRPPAPRPADVGPRLPEFLDPAHSRLLPPLWAQKPGTSCRKVQDMSASSIDQGESNGVGEADVRRALARAGTASRLTRRRRRSCCTRAATTSRRCCAYAAPDQGRRAGGGRPAGRHHLLAGRSSSR